MAMAVFVLLMVVTRFNRYLREYRAEQARVHQTDISRFSAAYTAFMLGISNMRRRKLRTSLTLGTITLLTFTVLSFSSFKPDVRFFAFSHRHEGAYEGALIRHHNWDWIGRWKMEAARSYFGERALLSPRNWYIADQAEEKKYIQVSHGERFSLSTALLGLSPQERGVTGVQTVLTAGGYFDSPDENSCLLPVKMAADPRYRWGAGARGQRARPRDHAAGAGTVRFRCPFRPARPRRRTADSRRFSPFLRRADGLPAAGGQGHLGKGRGDQGLSCTCTRTTSSFCLSRRCAAQEGSCGPWPCVSNPGATSGG